MDATLVDETAPTVESSTAETSTAGSATGEERVGLLSTGLLAGAALAWLVATLVTANASVLGNSRNPDVALGAAAFALPNLVAAGLVAGAAAALAATQWTAVDASAGRRLVPGLGAGAVLGAICAGLVVFGYGTYAQVAALAVTVGVACLLGGAAAALPRPVLAAGLLASLAVLVVGVVAGLVQPGLVGFFGGGATLTSQVNASWTVAYVVAIVGGGAAGVLAFWLLRRHGPRAWPWYLLAGALPGFLLLATELLTRVGGASLLDVVRDLSEGDRLVVDFTAFSRLRNALIVTFVGGLAAMVAVGRTLGAASAGHARTAS
jgi:hypothetical protein